VYISERESVNECVGEEFLRLLEDESVGADRLKQ
jgi:hypothetical protein